MIPSSQKFPLRTQFMHFRSRATRQVTPHFTCFYLSSPLTKMGVVVPKKLSKLATTRNWLKRLTYDTIWPLIKAQKLDCVVVYKPLPLTQSPATKAQIIHELATLKLV